MMIVHHKGALDGSPFPPNSLEAIRACLEAGATHIEVDVFPLKHKDYLLVHDAHLERETSGQGRVIETTPYTVQDLFIQHRQVITPYRPPLLSAVVRLFEEFDHQAQLQLDFKCLDAFNDDEPLSRLLMLIEPIKDQVIISSTADWHLRRLHALAPDVKLGFDIQLYWDAPRSWDASGVPPHRLGAYGYLDDDPLADSRTMTSTEYFNARCKILRGQVSSAEVWYVNHHLLIQLLDDGFNLATWLHEHDLLLDAWTLDVGKSDTLEKAVRLLQNGVDLFTTNTPNGLADYLGL